MGEVVASERNVALIVLLLDRMMELQLNLLCQSNKVNFRVNILAHLLAAICVAVVQGVELLI